MATSHTPSKRNIPLTSCSARVSRTSLIKLKMMKEQEQAEKVSDIRGEIKEIGFGNQIRSYVMQPYTLVKDHRTNVESGNVNAVLDGGIDMFINAYLKETVNS